jgi:uncharacterized protein (TIGR01244 family)
MAYKTFTFFPVLFFVSIIAYSQGSKIAVSEPIMINKSYNLYKAGDIFLAGQPNKEELDSLINSGVKLVINLRTSDELTHLDFDEKKYLKKNKIQYLHIPMGGSDGYQPEAITKMGNAIRSASGQVLIHCQVAGRATYAWMAWLIRYEDYSIDEAVRLGSKARYRVPFFDLLGFPVTIQKK